MMLRDFLEDLGWDIKELVRPLPAFLHYEVRKQSDKLLVVINVAGLVPSVSLGPDRIVNVSTKYPEKSDDTGVVIDGGLESPMEFSFIVPDVYDCDAISASWHNGLLTIEIPWLKEQKSTARAIPIREK
jgi:HSP20 family molecular chaperone IbpA